MTRAGFYVSIIAAKHNCLTGKYQKNHRKLLFGSCLVGCVLPLAVHHFPITRQATTDRKAVVHQELFSAVQQAGADQK